MQIATNDNTTHWCAHKKNDWPATQTLTETVVPFKFPSTVPYLGDEPQADAPNKRASDDNRSPSSSSQIHSENCNPH